MAMKGKNRYALLATSDDTHPSPLSPLPINNVNTWHEVKSRGKKAQTLVIRDENRRPVVSVPKRKVSPRPNSPTNEYEKPTEHWCGVCHMKFANKLALQNHVKQTPNHENYCNLCTRVFKDRNGLKNHVDHALGHDVYCNLCLSAFKDKWGLRNHFENNYSVKYHHFVCLVCLEGFTRQDLLNTHLATAPRHISCQTCHRNFRSQKERDDHWRTSAKHKHCLEPGCEFDGPNAAALEMHLNGDHFRCTFCCVIFISNTRLVAHEQSCTANLRCGGCRELFPTETKLAAHTAECTRLACEQCTFITENSEEYLRHKISHPKRIPLKTTCWTCDLPLQTQTAILKHLETGKCGKFTDPSLLIKVMGGWWYSTLYMDIDLHASIRQGRADMGELVKWMKEGNLAPYVCRGEGCGKSFSDFRALVHHLENDVVDQDSVDHKKKECGWTVERLRLDWLEKEIVGALNEGTT